MPQWRNNSRNNIPAHVEALPPSPPSNVFIDRGNGIELNVDHKKVIEDFYPYETLSNLGKLAFEHVRQKLRGLPDESSRRQAYWYVQRLNLIGHEWLGVKDIAEDSHIAEVYEISRYNRDEIRLQRNSIRGEVLEIAGLNTMRVMFADAMQPWMLKYSTFDQDNKEGFDARVYQNQNDRTELKIDIASGSNDSIERKLGLKRDQRKILNVFTPPKIRDVQAGQSYGYFNDYVEESIYTGDEKNNLVWAAGQELAFFNARYPRITKYREPEKDISESANLMFTVMYNEGAQRMHT